MGSRTSRRRADLAVFPCSSEAHLVAPERRSRTRSSRDRIRVMSEGFDAIVVGGGAAGCVIASRLTEDPNRSVLLLEAGPDYGAFEGGKWPKDILDADADADESHDWGFNGLSATRARIIGGCSSHNECAVVWAPPGDYATWTALGDEGWRFNEQRRCLERAQALLNTHVAAAEERNLLENSFLGAVEEVGLARLDDLNGPTWGPGAASLPKNVVDGVRWNTAFAYLDPARGRPNLTIQADTVVDRVTFEGAAARGVVAERLGWHKEFATRRVILTAGTYMSPAILQRSGIGPPDELERLGVDRVVDLPGVGTNLLDHPMVDVTFESRELVEPAAIHGFQDVLLKARSSRCSDEHWDTHVLLFVFLPDEGGITQIILSVGVVQSNSIGRIRLPSADPEVLPDLVQPFSALSDHDTAVLVEGIALIRRLAWTRALGRFVGNELEPGQGGDLESWVRANAAGYWHPVGTCRMGPSSDRFAVVDPTGRVHGTEGLVVADASIFPTTPRANTNLPTIAIAEFIASTIW
jgi:choline dehydrogenase